MSSPSERPVRRPPSDVRSVSTRPSRRSDLAVDRIACTGHGVCADLLPGRVVLDDWGYPALLDRPADPDDEERAVRMCPARALYRSGRSPR